MKGCSPCRSRRSGTGIGGGGGCGLVGYGWLQFVLVWTLLLSSSGLARGFTIEQPPNAVAGNQTALTYLQAATDPDSFTVEIVNAQNVVQASFPTSSTPPANGDPLQITLTLGTAFPPGTYTYQFFASNVPHRLAISAPFTVAPAVTVTKTTATATTSTSSTSTTAPPQTSMVMSMRMSTLSLSSATFTTVPPSSSTGAKASDTGAISSSSTNAAVVAVAIIVSLLALALVTALAFYVSRRRKLANFDAAGSGSSWWQRGKRSMFIAQPWAPPTPGADAEKGGVRNSYVAGYGATGQAEMAIAEADLQRNGTFDTAVISHARQSSDFLPPPTARRSRFSSAVLADQPYGMAAGSMPPSLLPPPMRERGAAGNLTVNVGAPNHRVSLPVTATPSRTYSVISPAMPPTALQPGGRPSWIYGRAGPAGPPRTPRVVWTLSVDGMRSSVVPPPRPLTPSDEQGEGGPSDTGAIMYGDTESSLSLDAVLREYDVASVHNSIEDRSTRPSFDSRSVAGPTEVDDAWSERDDDREDVSDAGSIDSRERLSDRPPEAPTTTRRGPSFRFSLASIFTTSGSSHRNSNSRPASVAIRRLPNPPLDRLAIPDSATFGALAPGGPSNARRSSLNRGFKFPSPIEALTPTMPSRALTSPRPLPPTPSPSSALPSSSKQQTQPFALSPNTPTPATSATPTARTRPPLPALPIPPALPPAAVTAPFRPQSGALTPFDRRSMRTSVMSFDSPGGASVVSTNSIHGAQVLLAHWQTMNRVAPRLTTLDETGQRRGPSPAPSSVDERW